MTGRAASAAPRAVGTRAGRIDGRRRAGGGFFRGNDDASRFNPGEDDGRARRVASLEGALDPPDQVGEELGPPRGEVACARALRASPSVVPDRVSRRRGAETVGDEDERPGELRGDRAAAGRADRVEETGADRGPFRVGDGRRAVRRGPRVPPGRDEVLQVRRRGGGLASLCSRLRSAESTARREHENGATRQIEEQRREASRPLALLKIYFSLPACRRVRRQRRAESARDHVVDGRHFSLRKNECSPRVP